MGKRPKKEDEMSEEYRKKRDRNNQAVKRSRVKSKKKTEETMARVNELRVQNKVLEDKIDTLSKELKFLKDLFLQQASAKADKIDPVKLRKLLAEDDSDDEGDQSMTSP